MNIHKNVKILFPTFNFLQNLLKTLINLSILTSEPKKVRRQAMVIPFCLPNVLRHYDSTVSFEAFVKVNATAIPITIKAIANK